MTRSWSMVGVTRNALLAFVLVSVGYIFGKEGRKPSPELAAGPERAARTTSSGAAVRGVIVYYLHATVRCSTCNTIERMTRQVLESQFRAEMDAGRVVWRTDDFQQNEALAKRYDIASSGVLLVRLEDGKEADFRRLDDTWTLMKDPPAFETYVATAVREFLLPGKDGNP